MDSQRAWEQYTFWFSYHLNHVHFQRKSHHVHRRPWPHCEKCTTALDKTKYEDRTGRFGLRSKQTRESATKVGPYLSSFFRLCSSIIMEKMDGNLRIIFGKRTWCY